MKSGSLGNGLSAAASGRCAKGSKSIDSCTKLSPAYTLDQEEGANSRFFSFRQCHIFVTDQNDFFVPAAVARQRRQIGDIGSETFSRLDRAAPRAPRDIGD